VYFGVLGESQLIAIKRFHMEEDFSRELRNYSQIGKHPNILTIIGYYLSVGTLIQYNTHH